MAKTKKIKYKQADGTLSDYIAIGADAKNIDLEEGITLEELNKQLPRVEENVLFSSIGEVIYPETKTNKITDENNNSLPDVLDEIDNKTFSQKQIKGTEIEVEDAAEMMGILQIEGNSIQQKNIGKNY